jgi:hypothetical protein
MNAIERVNAMAEIATKFAEMYNDWADPIKLINVSWEAIQDIPTVQISGIYNLAKLLDKEPYTLDDDVCVDYKGVRFFEVNPDND